MSRIGIKPVKMDSGITAKVDGKLISVTGPKGTLTAPLPKEIKFTQDGDKVLFSRNSDEVRVKALHGLTRSLFQNCVIGVTKGFQKRLELVGTGYRVRMDGAGIELSLGFSHPVKVSTVAGIELTIECNNIIYVKGIDKHLVGQIAANIRSLRPPEPYKGKGIRYSDEVVRRKAGKAAKGGEK